MTGGDRGGRLGPSFLEFRT